jgi:hypothetical protein
MKRCWEMKTSPCRYGPYSTCEGLFRTQVKTTSVSHPIPFGIYLDKQKYICIVGWYERIRKSFLLCFDYLGILRTNFRLEPL